MEEFSMHPASEQQKTSLPKMGVRRLVPDLLRTMQLQIFDAQFWAAEGKKLKDMAGLGLVVNWSMHKGCPQNQIEMTTFSFNST